MKSIVSRTASKWERKYSSTNLFDVTDFLRHFDGIARLPGVIVLGCPVLLNFGSKFCLPIVWVFEERDRNLGVCARTNIAGPDPTRCAMWLTRRSADCGVLPAHCHGALSGLNTYPLRSNLKLQVLNPTVDLLVTQKTAVYLPVRWPFILRI